MKGCSVLMIWAIVLCALATGPPLLAQSRTPEQDRAALTALENEWLANEHNPAALERILASDFVHPVPTGGFRYKSAAHCVFVRACSNDKRSAREESGASRAPTCLPRRSLAKAGHCWQSF